MDQSPPDQLPDAQIIPRPEHSISRGNIDAEALKVLYRLHRNGYTAFLVGGSVRDLLLGKIPKDFDIGTDARPSQVHRLFRNSRIIGRRFRLVQVFFNGGKVFEVSTFRRAADLEDDSVLSANNTFGSPAEDAMRRDLTINALFYNIADFSVVDYVDGLADLKAGLIRAVGPAEVRFRRDPVRVLRAVRHAARTGFSLTEDTLAAVREVKDDLKICPTSRIRDEVLRDLHGGAAAAWLELAHETGVLYSLFPGFLPYFGAADSPLRQEARENLARVDQAMAQGQPPSDAIIVSLLLWPILMRQAEEMELPQDRSGRAQWSLYVRDALDDLSQPVAFAKRMMERAGQLCGVMAWTWDKDQSQRLPKKLVDKGYFDDACALADYLGEDLRQLADGPPAGDKKRRRRRKRSRKKRPDPGVPRE